MIALLVDSIVLAGWKKRLIFILINLQQLDFAHTILVNDLDLVSVGADDKPLCELLNTSFEDGKTLLEGSVGIMVPDTGKRTSE